MEQLTMVAILPEAPSTFRLHALRSHAYISVEPLTAVL